MTQRELLILIGTVSLFLSLAACGHPQQSLRPVAKNETSGNITSPALQRTRAIIYFQSATSDNKQIFDAISDVCHCQPVFFRPYHGNALIYEIVMPQGQTFAVFAAELMQRAADLGIKAVDEDAVMQHQ